MIKHTYIWLILIITKKYIICSIILLSDNNTSTSIIKSNIKRVDINLLNGQALRVKVSSVRDISEFYVQLPSATECQDIINTYMADKNPEVRLHTCKYV